LQCCGHRTTAKKIANYNPNPNPKVAAVGAVAAEWLCMQPLP